MKLQVLLRSFGAPLLLAILFIVWLQYGMTPFQVFMQTVIVISFTLSTILRNERYVYTFAIRDGRIIVTCLTQFLKTKTVDLALSDIAEVKLSRRFSLTTGLTPVLALKSADQDLRMYVLTKKLYNEIEQHVISINMVTL